MPTITITADNLNAIDTQVSTSSSSAVGDSTTLYIGDVDLGGNATYGLIRFDLSTLGIPSNAVVTSAKMSMFYQSGITSSYLRAYRVTSAWDESTTYSNKPTRDTTDYTEEMPTNSTNIYADFYMTAIVQKWISGASPNYGVWLENHNSSSMPGLQYKTYNSSENTANRPTLVITYNVPPTAPVVNAPNGGEIVNKSYTITWNQSSDTETPKPSIRYHVQLSTNNGTTWKDLVALNTAGQNWLTYDFSNEPETAQALVRVRGYDGALYGDWDVSNAPFSIVHNFAPLAPSNLTRTNFDATQAANLVYQFNDGDDGDTISAQEVEIKDADTEAVVFTLAKTGTAQAQYTLPANTLTNNRNYQWRVKTYDRAGLASPWSTYATFRCAATPNVSLTAPAPNAVIGRSSYVFIGSYVHPTGNVEQSHRFRLYNAAGTALLQDSGEIIGYANQYEFSNLANGTAYTVEFSATSVDAITGTTAKIPFQVDFTPPPIPLVTAENDAPNARVIVTWTNPTPSAGVPTATRNDVYRRKAGETAWALVGENASSPHIDRTAPAGKMEYGVTAVAPSGTVSTHGITTVTHTFAGNYVLDDELAIVGRFLWNNEGVPITFEDNAKVTPTFAKMPFVSQSETPYHAGTLDALAMESDGDMMAQIGALKSLCMTQEPRLLKMAHGENFTVKLSGLRYKPTHGGTVAEISVNWTQVAE